MSSSREDFSHVFDHVAVCGIVAEFNGNGIVVFGMAFIGVERVVVDVAAFAEKAAAQIEELLMGAGAGGSDADVGDLLAVDGVATPGADRGVLDIDVAGALGLGMILQSSDAGHDGGSRGRRGRSVGLGVRDGGREQDRQRQTAKRSPEQKHGRHYGRKRRLVPMVRAGEWKGLCWLESGA